MKTSYKKGDIVELINFSISPGQEGYYQQQIGFIPQVGHRYYVTQSTTKDGSMVVVSGTKGNFGVYFSQVMIYKPANNKTT